MKRPLSIRSRFLLVSLIAVPAALGLAALFMVAVFSASLERRLEAELTAQIRNIAAAIPIGADGAIARPAGLFEQRFGQAYSGLYWQIGDEADLARFRSESLWDFTLTLPHDLPTDGSGARFEAPGPDGARLIAFERQIMIGTAAGMSPIQITVAADAQALDTESQAFARDIVPYLAGLAVLLIGASLLQVAIGLRPLSALAAGLDRIRERRQGKLEGVLPVEFAPVEDAVNRLVDAQAQSLDTARARAGDLAHGLKTPLTVLSNDALTLREKGDTAMADEIDQLVATMQGYVEHELTRSRIATSAEMRKSDADVGKVVGQVVATLQRTPQGEALDWRVEILAPADVPMDPHDLRELVGNLMENAGKWAKSEVSVRWANRVLVVADDGPGVDPQKIPMLTQRGVRLDSRVPGTGLGLSIVAEICSVYGLRLGIENRQGSGLMVSVRF